MGNDNGEWQYIRRVKQGGVMSSGTFLVYCETILRYIEEMKGIKGGRINIYNIRDLLMIQYV